MIVPRIGLIARADNSGLGIQTLEFYRNMKPDKTMVVDISKFNNNPIFPERYPDGIFIRGFPTANDIDKFLIDLDVVFVAESPYNYYLYQRARELGVKTAAQYNYEFFDWYANPTYPKPDMLIAPSYWHYKDVDAWCKAFNRKHIHLPCPVNTDKLPGRIISEAKTFLHQAGRSAAHDRNGTETVIKASKYLTGQSRIVIHFQGEQGLPHQATKTIDDYRQLLELDGDPDRVTIVTQELAEYQDAYAMGDVLLLPRRYGGNCLPLNEALSAGMPVLMTDISPNEWLPKWWLTPAAKVGQFAPRTIIDIYEADPQDYADKINEFAEMTEKEMLAENQRALTLADSISWESLKPKYQEVFEDLCSL